MMSEQQFDVRLQHLQEQYAARKLGAEAYRDQELARLFEECCWTQERIAERMGKKQPWVAKRLTFGRFLGFIPTGNKNEIGLEILTERRFRAQWQRTKGADDERFAQVLHRLEEGIPQGYEAMRRKPEVLKAVRDCLEDGQWYTVSQITATAEEALIGLTEDQVRSALAPLRQKPPPGRQLQSKQIGKIAQYRLRKVRAEKPGGPPAALLDLYESVAPLIEELDEIGRMHECRMSPPAVLKIAIRLRRLFDAVLKQQPSNHVG